MTSYFGQIELAAREQNNWQLVAAIQTHPGGDGKVPHGFAIIKRDHAPTGREGTEYATTMWASHYATDYKPSYATFGESNYDLTIEEAFEDFVERAKGRVRV